MQGIEACAKLHSFGQPPCPVELHGIRGDTPNAYLASLEIWSGMQIAFPLVLLLMRNRGGTPEEDPRHLVDRD